MHIERGSVGISHVTAFGIKILLALRKLIRLLSSTTIRSCNRVARSSGIEGGYETKSKRWERK